jgi:dienelactone hydrolase
MEHESTDPLKHSLTDSFARAGFLAVAPDLFNGDEAPTDLTNFNITAWSARHGPDVTEPILAKGLAYLKAAGVEKIATAGYCYGGRYAFRLLASSWGGDVDAAYAAHPSFLGDDEIAAITGPASIAAAGKFPSCFYL